MIGAHLSELFERKLKNSENNRWISTVQTYQLHQLLLPRRYLYKTNFYFATLLDIRRPTIINLLSLSPNSPRLSKFPVKTSQILDLRIIQFKSVALYPNAQQR